MNNIIYSHTVGKNKPDSAGIVFPHSNLVILQNRIESICFAMREYHFRMQTL